MNTRKSKLNLNEQLTPLTKTNICPLCNRELDDDYDEHHLIPKTFKGKDTVCLHRVCHDKIHSTFTERELLKEYFTIEKILTNTDIQTFVEWIKKKPIDFFIGTKDHNIRKGKRRR
jgi:hypothetical protein